MEVAQRQDRGLGRRAGERVAEAGGQVAASAAEVPGAYQSKARRSRSAMTSGVKRVSPGGGGAWWSAASVSAAAA
jgi:hypothetical protein